MNFVLFYFYSSGLNWCSQIVNNLFITKGQSDMTVDRKTGDITEHTSPSS